MHNLKRIEHIQRRTRLLICYLPSSFHPFLLSANFSCVNINYLYSGWLVCFSILKVPQFQAVWIPNCHKVFWRNSDKFNYFPLFIGQIPTYWIHQTRTITVKLTTFSLNLPGSFFNVKIFWIYIYIMHMHVIKK